MTHPLLQQAVEALRMTARVQGVSFEYDLDQMDEAIKAARATLPALESALQQQPEPVAIWQSCATHDVGGTKWIDCSEENARAAEQYGFPARVLYTTPPALTQREPVALADVFQAFMTAAQCIIDHNHRELVSDWLTRAWHHKVLPALQQQEEPREAAAADLQEALRTAAGEACEFSSWLQVVPLDLVLEWLAASPHPPAANPPAAQVKCLYCTRDMIAGLECGSEEQAEGCEGLAGGVPVPDPGDVARRLGLLRQAAERMAGADENITAGVPREVQP